MNAVMLNCAGKREKQIFEFRRTQASSGLQKSSHSNAEPDGDRATWPVKGQRNQHRVSLFKLFWNRRTGGPLQCWTRSGFRIAIQTGFCNSGQEPDRTGFRKGLYRIRYGYPNHVYHSSQMLKSVFGCKPDWIKCLGSTTGLGSGWITQWNHWTGLRLQKYPIRSTLVLLSHLQQLYGNSDRSSSWHHSDRSGSWHHSDRSGSWHHVSVKRFRNRKKMMTLLVTWVKKRRAHRCVGIGDERSHLFGLRIYLFFVPRISNYQRYMSLWI